MKKEIKVFSDTQPMFGEIEILNATEIKAYVAWRIFDEENNLIASLTNNYFLGDKPFTTGEIFELVKNQILKYRMGRKKIFTSVEFND